MATQGALCRAAALRSAGCACARPPRPSRAPVSHTSGERRWRRRHSRGSSPDDAVTTRAEERRTGGGARFWGLRSAHALLRRLSPPGFSSSRRKSVAARSRRSSRPFGPPRATPATATTVGPPDTGDPRPSADARHTDRVSPSVAHDDRYPPETFDAISTLGVGKGARRCGVVRGDGRGAGGLPRGDGLGPGGRSSWARPWTTTAPGGRRHCAGAAPAPNVSAWTAR